VSFIPPSWDDDSIGPAPPTTAHISEVRKKKRKIPKDANADGGAL
jgi:hypothetical protein